MSNVNNPPISSSSGISSQTDVTASRALDGTVYHNTTTKPIMCMVNATCSGGGAVLFKSDATASPSLSIGQIYNLNASAIQGLISFWVLPGYYYKGTITSTATLVTWIEYT